MEREEQGAGHYRQKRANEKAVRHTGHKESVLSMLEERLWEGRFSPS